MLLRRLTTEVGVSQDFFDCNIFPKLATLKSPYLWTVERPNFEANMSLLLDFLLSPEHTKTEKFQFVTELFSNYDLNCEWAEKTLDFDP